MSETPMFTVPEYSERLTDREIENRVNDAEFDLWEEQLTPPVWDGPETRHEVVQAPSAYQVEAQPSIVEQHNRMTDEQNIAYIGAITPHVSHARQLALQTT